MARSRYGRDAFETARIVSVVCTISVALFFALAHSLNRYRRYRYETDRRTTKASARVARLTRAILMVNWVAVLFLVPFGVIYILVSMDDNVDTCKIIHSSGSVSYVILNFLFYRVLLFRSQAFDAMREYRRLYKLVLWGVHLVSFSYLILAPVNGMIASYEIITANVIGGNRLCVVTKFNLIPFSDDSIVLGLLFALSDLAISLGCLFLLALPLLKPGFTPSRETGAIRNIFFSSIAIISTFVTLLSQSIVEKEDGYWAPGLLMDIGWFDILINIVSVNLCWPPSFYIGLFHYLCGIHIPRQLSRQKRKQYTDESNPTPEGEARIAANVFIVNKSPKCPMISRRSGSPEGRFSLDRTASTTIQRERSKTFRGRSDSKSRISREPSHSKGRFPRDNSASKSCYRPTMGNDAKGPTISTLPDGVASSRIPKSPYDFTREDTTIDSVPFRSRGVVMSPENTRYWRGIPMSPETARNSISKKKIPKTGDLVGNGPVRV
ncbi:hypothetical protein AAMO2058_000166500 [Amorphochlora amoebiformis]